jgi:hypothetical protein
MHLTDDELADLARSLDARLHAEGVWHGPARLYGLGAAREWSRLAQGDPYRFLDTVRIDEAAVAALALVAMGWAFPPDRPETWHGRPSAHPDRVRVRTTTVVTPDRRHCSVVRRRDTGEILVDTCGEGPLLRALVAVWRPPATPAA